MKLALREWLHLGLALAFGASCGAPQAPPPAPRVAPAHLATPPTPPEIEHVAMRNPSSSVVSLRAAFLSGSADDPVDRSGLTRLLATTMVRGGTERLSYAELVQALFPMAAEIRTHVDRDETVFEGEVTSDALEAFYGLFKEVLLTPRLDVEGFERMRARATSELVDDLRGANDEELGKEALQALLYEGHPYGHPPVGTERGIAAATLDDVRAQRGKVFCRERALAGVAGGFPEGFADRMARDLEALPSCTAHRAPLPAPEKVTGIQVLIIDKPSAEATAISLGEPVPVTRSSADYPALLFAMDYLGLHRSSAAKLYQVLRERRGLNYGDYAYGEFFEQEGSWRFPRTNLVRRQQMASLWIRPVKPQNAIFALRAVLSYYSRFLANGLTDDEIARYRSFLSRYLALDQLTEARRLGYAMDDEAYGMKEPYLEALRDAWKSLDHDRLDAVTDRTLDASNLVVAMVAKDGDSLADLLVKGDSTPPVYDSPKPPDVVAEDEEIARYPLWLKHENVRVVKVGEIFR